jgi:DNA-binding NarL/FixJ family response regulator
MMQTFFRAIEEMAGADGRPCRTVLVGELGPIPHWQDAAAALRLPLLQAPTAEEADHVIGSDAPAIVVAPLCLFLDGASTEAACRWLSMAAVVVVADSEADAALWRQLAWDALTPPQSADIAIATLTKAVAEANRRGNQRHLITAFAHRFASLSACERNVFDAVCEGRLNKQIASELKVSVRTIEMRRRRVFDKMGVDSAVPLAAITAIVKTLNEQKIRQHRAPVAMPKMYRAPKGGAPTFTTPYSNASLASSTMH